MAMQIRVLYEDEDELRPVLELLSPIPAKYKFLPPKGRYKRLYITAKSIPTKPAKPQK